MGSTRCLQEISPRPRDRRAPRDAAGCITSASNARSGGTRESVNRRTRRRQRGTRADRARAGRGRALSFLGSRTSVKASAETTAGRVAVIEHLSPRGSGSPLHIHSSEDEWFYVIEGELTFWVGGQVISAPTGSFIYGPRGVPHTFLVASEIARFLLVTEPAGFSGFIRTLAEPAQSLADSAATERAARPCARGPGRRRLRDRDPRPARDPGLSSGSRVGLVSQSIGWSSHTPWRITVRPANSFTPLHTCIRCGDSWTYGCPRRHLRWAPCRARPTPAALGRVR